MATEAKAAASKKGYKFTNNTPSAVVIYRKGKHEATLSPKAAIVTRDEDWAKRLAQSSLEVEETEDADGIVAAPALKDATGETEAADKKASAKKS